MTEAELRPLVEKAFGAWPAGTAARAGARRAGDDRRRIVLVDKPGAPQTQLLVATIGAAAIDAGLSGASRS